MTAGHCWCPLYQTRCTRSLLSMNPTGQSSWRQGRHCACPDIITVSRSCLKLFIYLLLICEINKNHLACGCQGPKHRAALGTPSPGCPGCFGRPVTYCLGHKKHLSHLSETLANSYKGFCSHMTFLGNPEQRMNREVHSPLAVPLGNPQSAPMLHKSSMQSVVTAYWCISFFPLKTRAVFDRH